MEKKIRKATKLYRDSWIIQPIDRAIRFIEARTEGKECKCYTYPSLCFHNYIKEGQD